MHCSYARQNGVGGCSGRYVAGRSGASCIATQEVIEGHRWCNNCAAREGRLIDLDTGMELVCNETVEADVVVIKGRAFDLTAMTVDEREEIDLVFASGTGEVPQAFGQYEVEVDLE